MITNLPKLVTAAMLALGAPALRAQDSILLNLATSRPGPWNLAVSFTGAPDTATTLLVLGYDRLAYFAKPEIPLYVQPTAVLVFDPTRAIRLPYELLAPGAPTSYLQALSYDVANPVSPWSSSKTWRIEAGRADALAVEPQLKAWLVATDAVPPEWTLMAAADVLPGSRSLRVAGVERLAGSTRVQLRLSSAATDDAQGQETIAVPLGSAPGLEVAVYYGVGSAAFEQVALLPTR